MSNTPFSIIFLSSDTINYYGEKDKEFAIFVLSEIDEIKSIDIE